MWPRREPNLTAELAAMREHLRKLEAREGMWPLPACRVYNDANLPTLTGVLTALTFNSERYDTDDMHSVLANTNRITFNTAGIYAVVAQVNWETQTPPVGRRWVGIQLNGVTYITQFEVAAEVVDGRFNISFPTHYEFAATDWIQVMVFHTAGIALNVQSNANYSPEFSAARIA